MGGKQEAENNKAKEIVLKSEFKKVKTKQAVSRDWNSSTF